MSPPLFSKEIVAKVLYVSNFDFTGIAAESAARRKAQRTGRPGKLEDHPSINLQLILPPQWVIIDSSVYDISKFVTLHPGGLSVLLNEDIGTCLPRKCYDNLCSLT